MKKLLIIFIFLILVALGAWIFLRDTSTPIVETIKNGLPFGSGEDINIPAVTNNPQPTTNNSGMGTNISSDTKILQLSNTPVAGFVSFPRGTTTIVRFVDRATGHIFDITLPKAGVETSLEKVRVTNTTLPKIYEAHFRSDGSTVLIRSLLATSDVVENTTLALTPPKAASSTDLYSIAATKLRGDMDSVVVGVANSLSYVTKNNSSIVSSTFTGTETKTLFSSSFNNWRLFKLGTGTGLYTKASGNVPGYVYSLSGGTLTKLVGPLNGLTAIGNSNGTKILYSYLDGTTKLFIKDLKKNTSAEILPASLAEKCVWSIKNEGVFFCGTPLVASTSKEPDGWYLGRTHFSDYFWKFDTSSEISQLIAEPKAEFDLDLDAFELKLTPAEDYLIFMNKRDLSLWAVKL